LQAYPLSDHEQEMPGERASFNFKVPGKIFDKNKDKNFQVFEKEMNHSIKAFIYCSILKSFCTFAKRKKIFFMGVF
jgi:hypothetical protein